MFRYVYHTSVEPSTFSGVTWHSTEYELKKTDMIISQEKARERSLLIVYLTRDHDKRTYLTFRFGQLLTTSSTATMVLFLRMVRLVQESHIL